MVTIQELTEDDFKLLLDEYFAPAKARSKMTEQEIIDLAIKLNKKIDVPLVSETGEEKIIIKIVIKIDRFLYDNLPNEFYDLIRSIKHGINDKEAERLIKRLSKLANKKIDIPYLPEIAEYFAIKFIIGILINAARKSWNLNLAKEKASKIDIPKIKNARVNLLEK